MGKWITINCLNLRYWLVFYMYFFVLSILIFKGICVYFENFLLILKRSLLKGILTYKNIFWAVLAANLERKKTYYMYYISVAPQIEVKADLPVGEGLQDHLQFPFPMYLNTTGHTFDSGTPFWTNLEYKLFGTGKFIDDNFLWCI